MSKQSLGFIDPIDIKVTVERTTRDALQHICDEMNSHTNNKPRITIPDLIRAKIDDDGKSLLIKIRRSINQRNKKLGKHIQEVINGYSKKEL